MKRCAWLLGLACAALSACASLPAADRATGTASAAFDRQILVMLRVPAEHFRPDLDYTSAYGGAASRGGARRSVEALARRYDLTVLAGWPMPALGLDCFVLEAFGREATADLIAAISRDQRVEWAQKMSVYHVLGHNDPLYSLQPSGRIWHLAELHRITTGRDVRVAEVDTGVDVEHPDLRGRVTLARDFVGTGNPAREAHGTAIAGIIAARADDGLGIAGVAPDASLLALRACWEERGKPSAVCTSFTLAKALQFALDENVRIINLSLGGPRDRLLERLLDVAVARRVVVVAAVDPSTGDGGFPASHPGVLPVAAKGGRDPPPGALLAPAIDIPAPLPGQAWGFVTGTSFAAAQVSGLAALLLERTPSLEPARLRRELAAIAPSSAAPDRAATVDACAAIAHTTGLCACGCAVLARDADPHRVH
jgi:subtilisin family serine protease